MGMNSNVAVKKTTQYHLGDMPWKDIQAQQAEDAKARSTEVSGCSIKDIADMTGFSSTTILSLSNSGELKGGIQSKNPKTGIIRFVYSDDAVLDFIEYCKSEAFSKKHPGLYHRFMYRENAKPVAKSNDIADESKTPVIEKIETTESEGVMEIKADIFPKAVTIKAPDGKLTVSKYKDMSLAFTDKVCVLATTNDGAEWCSKHGITFRDLVPLAVNYVMNHIENGFLQIKGESSGASNEV